MRDFRKKLLVQLGLMAGVLVVLGGLIAYVFSDLKSVGESIEKARAAITIRAQAISSLNSLREDAQEAMVLVNQLRNALPSRESLFVFSEEMSQLARSRGLTPSFNFGSEIAGSAGAPSRIEFMMNVAGSYQSILSFISAFESSRYFTRISSLEFISQGANISSYQAIMSGEVFFRGQ